MAKPLKDLLQKQEFNIQDMAAFAQRKTDTIRLWEYQGVILGSDYRSPNNWRLYSRARVAENLEMLLNRPWKRTTYDHPEELQAIINVLRSQPNGDVKNDTRD